MEEILVIGASGHAKVVVEAIELSGKYKIHGFIDSYKSKDEKVLGYTIFGTEDLLKDFYDKGIKKGVIAIGDNWTRYVMKEKIKELVPDFEFITVIHPSAVVSKYAKIGNGTVVLASVNINAEAVVGDFCILNTNANFGHDSLMKDFSSLAPNVTVGGNVRIGEYTAISLGASVIHNLKIGKQTVIGAGSVVTQNIEGHKVVYGIPAKVIRDRKEGDYYLNSASLDTNFKIKKIKDKESLDLYKKNINELHNSNPFYKTELLDTTDMNQHELFYFMLEKQSKPIIIMPMYMRKIMIDNIKTGYKDVLSPYGYSGPLFDMDQVDGESIRHFWKQVDSWYKKKKVVTEFIRFSLNQNHIFYSGVLIPSLKNVRGRILDEKEQWDKFKQKVRNNYRKSLQKDLKLQIYESPIEDEVIESFYNIYIGTMERNNAHSQYFHNVEYFKEFIKNNPESCAIAMVYYEDKPISTELLLMGDDTVYSYLGGTLADYFYTRPNDFLKIQAMSWAREKNYEYYVLGGGRVDDDGLYKYKKSFFPSDGDVIYYTGRKIVNQEVYEEMISLKCKEDTIENREDITKNFFPLYRLTD